MQSLEEARDVRSPPELMVHAGKLTIFDAIR